MPHRSASLVGISIFNVKVKNWVSHVPIIEDLNRVSPLGKLEALLPTLAVVGAAVTLLVRFWIIEPIRRAVRAVGDVIVAVDDA